MKEVVLDNEVSKSKQFISGGTSSVYNTISNLLSNVLEERPSCGAEIFDSYLDKVFQKDTNENKQDITKQGNFAETQIKLFDKSNDEDYGDGVENEEEFEIPLPNCTQLAFYFEQAGIGLGREETYRIFLALKQLVFTYPLSSIRFWGKIFGLEADYIIAEAEYREGEGEVEVDAEGEEEEAGNKDDMLSDEDNDDGPTEEDSIPKSTWKPTPPIPKEDHRTGVNKKVYFVCNQPGEQWVKLPHVTPTEIKSSRGVSKLLSGRLDAKVESYPPFPGNEANYLRAQIARISSSTQISPAGYYTFDDEEEEEEEDEMRDSYVLNVDFEGMSLKELTDSSMVNWVHHTQHILSQGRCSWFNLNEKPEDDFEEQDFDEDDEESAMVIQPETGPPLLYPVVDDTPISGTTPAWSTSVSSRVLPEYAIAVARSNRWPGAVAFATPKTFGNLYIGWGNKYTSTCYNPPAPPPAFDEFPDSEEVTEMDDPTVEEERAVKEREDEAMRAAEDMENEDDEDDEDE